MICKDPKKRNEYMRDWKRKNKDKVRKWKRDWGEKNKDKVNKDNRKYRGNNREKKREYDRKRRQTDTYFRVVCNLRTRFCNAIRSEQKVGSAVRDLGCSIPEFKEYIETKFEPGMSWENWGPKTWHIDHIKPLASYDLTNREQFLEAVHYSNYQPLWKEDHYKKTKEDNLKKGASL